MTYKLLTLVSALLFLGAGPSVAQTSTNKDQIVETPFTFVRGSVVLQVKIKDKGPFNMVLSTGSAASTLSSELSRELKLQAFFGPSSYDPKTNTYGSYTQVSGLRTSQNESMAWSLNMSLAGLSSLSQDMGIPIHGILGYAFLKGKIIQIDYPNRIIRFIPDSAPPDSQPTNTAAPKQRVVIPFQITSEIQIPIIGGVVIDGKEVRALLDTSQGVAVALTPEAVKLLGFPAVPEKGPPRIDKVSEIKIGALQVGSPRTAFFGKGSGKDHALGEYGAVFGGDLLSNFVVTFDYQRKRIVFEQR